MIRIVCAALAFVMPLMISGAVGAQQRGLPNPISAGSAVMVQNVTLAQADGSAVKLEVETSCENGIPSFKIVNRGTTWPAMGTLKVLRVTNAGIETVTTQQMRFAAGQRASFRMKNAGDDTVGLYVDPSWYEREFTFDAKLHCGKAQ